MSSPPTVQGVNISVDEDSDALFVDNASTGEIAGGISATTHGRAHGVEGVAYGPGIGVRGISQAPEGGDYGNGPSVGVHGQSGTGVGVLGIATQAGIGVEARSDTPDGIALQVRGKTTFTTGGSAAVPAGGESVFVAHPDVTEESHISVTLVSDPGIRQVLWVERDPGNGFTVYFTPAPPRKRPETHLTYLITEPNA
jgi:hypothetical protein